MYDFGSFNAFETKAIPPPEVGGGVAFWWGLPGSPTHTCGLTSAVWKYIYIYIYVYIYIYTLMYGY